MLIFCLDSDKRLAQSLAATLDQPLSPHELRRFADGESKLRPMVNPRGSDAYVIHSLHGDLQDSPNDKLCRLLMFAAALRDHGADRVTAVVPYMAYARKDRVTQPYDPVSLRYVAQMFEAVDVAQVMSMEVHNASAFENAFRRSAWYLPAHDIFIEFVGNLDECSSAERVVVASPDLGGAKRAQLFREALQSYIARPVGFALVDKRRSLGLTSSEGLVAGDVHDACVVLYDDLIATGVTMMQAATALRQAGARRVLACAPHGLWDEAEQSALDSGAFDKVIVSDTVPPFRLHPNSPGMSRLSTVSCAPAFAAAMRDSHGAWRR